jgi:hypothetical protein
VQEEPNIGRLDRHLRVHTVVDDPSSNWIVGFIDDIHAGAEEANSRARTAAAEVRMRLADHVQHRTAVTQSADAVLRRRVEGRVNKERPSSLLGRRDSKGQLRRRSTGGERLERIRGEEMSVSPLEFCYRIELRCRVFHGVLIMVVDSSKCLLLDRGRPSVVVQQVARVGRLEFRIPGSFRSMTASRNGRWVLATKIVRFDSDLMLLDDFR